MPLSEFLERAGKLGSGQQKMASTTDLSSFPENEVVELVWENGQLMMQGQPSRAKKRTTFNNLSSNASNIRVLENSSTSKIEKFGAMNSMLNDMPSSVPTREVDMSQEDDVVPWLSYSADDSLQQDYCSQLLPDISGVAANEPSRQMTGVSHGVPIHNVENLEQRNASKVSHNSRFSLLRSWTPQKGHASVPSLGSGFSDIVSSNTTNATSSQSGFATLDKKGCSDRSIGGSHNVQIHNDNLEQRSTPKVYPTSRFGQLSSWSPQKGHASVPSLGSGVSNIVSSNTINNPVSGFGNSNQSQASDGGIKRMTIQKQNMTSGDSCLFNFAHFSRPSTFHKGSLNGESAVAGSSIVAVKGNNERENVASCSNPVSANPVEPHFSSEKENDLHFQPTMASSKVDLRTSLPFHLDRSCPVEQSDNLCRDNMSNNDKSPGQFTGESATKEYPDGKRNVEPAVACSSVCSASSAERASSAQPHNRKRKSHDNEESGCRSEDVEEESFNVKRAGHVHRSAGSKRGRAAEVHNLSERKRRDRINEKMRALQELIPNCNRADKASMLDEAIEYLKTLQLQIQIMSMGAGLCAPPMMFPMGMGHMPATHMPHFSPMGLRMGMGFGMGMHENGGSPGCPIFPMPTPPQGAHFPSPPVPGSTIFPGYNLHAFGYPGQGPPISAPQAPFVPLAGQPSTSSAMGLNVARTGVHADTPSQVQATNEAQDKSAFVAEK